MILTPEYIFKTIECIHPDFLAAHGIKALVLDVDNTLTADNSQVLEPTVQAWLDEMRAAGIRLTIVSNNTAKRVRPFAERIGLDWVPLACKPFTIGLRWRAAAWAAKRAKWPWSATRSLRTGWPPGCTAARAST